MFFFPIFSVWSISNTRELREARIYFHEQSLKRANEAHSSPKPHCGTGPVPALPSAQRQPATRVRLTPRSILPINSNYPFKN